MPTAEANGTLMARGGLGHDHCLTFSQVELGGLEPPTPCLQSMAKVSSTVYGLARSGLLGPPEYSHVQACWCRLSETFVAGGVAVLQRCTDRASYCRASPRWCRPWVVGTPCCRLRCRWAHRIGLTRRETIRPKVHKGSGSCRKHQPRIAHLRDMV